MFDKERCGGRTGVLGRREMVSIECMELFCSAFLII